MAAKGPTGQDKLTQKTSSVYTLPVSCQICFGKVRQPVLCSNFHVFCRMCIDTWLERSHRCPSCRVLIDDTNPVQHIRGGLNQADNEDREKSTPELRKTRFDLLYKDYEDTIEHLEHEIRQLRFENGHLASQLASGQAGSGTSSSAKGHGGSTGTSEQQLQLLTAKLQDAQKLYERVKQDITKLKKDNNSLKETNANLAHENAKLREEISSRSPHKFGRLTVATLEAQLESQKKEVQRLTRALERSDQYIESLQQQLDRCDPSAHHQDTGSHMVNGNHKTSGSSSAARGAPSVADSGLPVKRQLFSMTSADSTGKLRSDHVDGKISDRLPLSSSPARPEGVLESIIRKSDPSSKTDSNKRDKSPGKKVHFSVTEKKSDDSSSFNLEAPSPIALSASGDSSLDKVAPRLQSAHRNGLPPRSSDKSQSSRDWEFSLAQQKENDLSSKRLTSHSSAMKEGSLSSVLKHCDHVSRKEQTDPKNNSNLSEPGCSTPPSLNELDLGQPRSYGKRGAFSKETVGQRDSSRNKGSNSSFNLEEPSLDDTQTIQTELKDLDISMTPELSDCLKLLNRAEKKVSHTETPCLVTPAGTVTSGHREWGGTTSTAARQPATLDRRCGSAPPGTTHSLPAPSQEMTLGKGHVERIYPGSSGSSGFAGTYMPGTTGAMSSWEHGFFSSLRVNPYRHAAPHTHHDTASQMRGISDGISQPGGLGLLSGQSRPDQSARTSLALSSRASSLTDVRRNDFSHTSTIPSSSKPLLSGAYSSSNLTRSFSSEHLSTLPSSSATSSAAVGFPSSSSLSSAHPSVSAFSSEGQRLTAPVSSQRLSVYPSSYASSSAFSQGGSLIRDSHHLSNPSHIPAQGKSVVLPDFTAADMGQDYLFREKRPNNYSYVSNASSQGGDRADSNHQDSFLPEPKKRLFDLDSEEESDFGTPSKTTKIL
ncbi:uncharacterized protein LOC143283953 [Babylonia areolata]|uniref:uncharacterized protein LOC143283953 n=1 Tax=Babylonia areolata TaxID=304850 RepID=UPI003FD096A2